MTSQPGQQTIVIHILTNISKGKNNQAMKFGQIIEYNLRNIFLEKSYSRVLYKRHSRLFFLQNFLNPPALLIIPPPPAPPPPPPPNIKFLYFVRVTRKPFVGKTTCYVKQLFLKQI